MKQGRLTALLAALTSLTVFQPVVAEELNFVVMKKPLSRGLTDVVITSRQNTIRVLEVVVNRGACNGSKVPVNMRFGETTSLVVADYCNPLEVEVKTDRGSFRTGWER